MKENIVAPMIRTYISRGSLIVYIHVEVYDEIAIEIQNDILEKIKTTKVKGVVIDISGVKIIDSYFAKALKNTAKMATVLGAITVIVGFTPGVVISLVDLDVNLEDIKTAHDVDDGLDKIDFLLKGEEKDELGELNEKK